jgi:hypothetical protein
MELDPDRYSDVDPREVNPPIQVEMATWSNVGQLDWWVKERGKWMGRVRGEAASMVIQSGSCNSHNTRPIEATPGTFR